MRCERHGDPTNLLPAHFPSATSTTFVRLPPLGGEGWGGGTLRVYPRFRECTSNRIDNRVDVLVQLLITAAEETKAARGEPVSAALIVFDGIRLQMLRAVEFNDQLGRKAEEVNHVGTDHTLATEFMAVELPGAEEMPKALFGAGGPVAK
jgi:hypothetical protein